MTPYCLYAILEQRYMRAREREDIGCVQYSSTLNRQPCDPTPCLMLCLRFVIWIIPSLPSIPHDMSAAQQFKRKTTKKKKIYVRVAHVSVTK